MLDLKDKKILYELDLDSRQTNKQIAKKVRLSEQVVGNRIKRLQDLNIIENFYVKTNPTILGYMHIKVYLRLQNLSKEKEKELNKELKNKKNIFWLASLRGKYDLVISILVKNISEFTGIYEELINNLKIYILERNVVILEKALTYSKSYLVDKEPTEIIYRQGKEQIIELDQININILKILNIQGRKNLIEIAKELNISSDTIRYRINNLKNKGIITGFGTKMNFKKIDYNYSILSLKLQNMTQEKYNKLKAYSKQNKNIITYIQTIGDHDIELEIEYKNELEDIIRELKNLFTYEIKNYEILEVTEQHTLNYYPF